MKSSTSRTTGNGGVYPNYTILFLLLLVVGDLGIQSISRDNYNSRLMARMFLKKKKGNKTEELTKDDDVVNGTEKEINAEFAKRILSLAKSVLESYELFNKAASTGMNQTQWTNLQKKMEQMENEFNSIPKSFKKSMNNEILDSEIYRAALENYYKLQDKLDTQNKTNDFFQPYKPLEPEDMHINSNSFASFDWWKKMSKTKKIALIGSITGIALLTGSISAYFGIRHSMSSDQDDEPKPANDLSMKQIKQPVDNERLVTKKDKQKSGGTAMLVVVLLIATAIGLSLVTYLCVQYLRNQADANAPSRPKSNNKSEGSTSSTTTTKDPHNNHHDKSSKKKRTKSPKSNGELKSNSSATN